MPKVDHYDLRIKNHGRFAILKGVPDQDPLNNLEAHWITTAITYHGNILALSRQTERFYTLAQTQDAQELIEFLRVTMASYSLPTHLIPVVSALTKVLEGGEPDEAMLRDIESRIEPFQQKMEQLLGHKEELKRPDNGDLGYLLHSLRISLNTVRTANVTPQALNDSGLSLGLVNVEALAKHQDLLMRLPNNMESVVTSGVVHLIVLFETLISDVIQLFYQRFPTALPDGHQVSLKEMREFGTVDKVIEYVIDNQIEELMRQSLEDWEKHFQKQFKLDLRQSGISWPRLQEIYQRRNLLVHNAGRVNRHYLHKVPSEARSSEQYGETLYTSLVYFQEAVQLFLSLGLYLLNGVWSKLYKDPIAARLGTFSHLATKAIMDKRWRDAQLLYQHMLDEPGLKGSSRMVAQLNSLLAEKRLNGRAAIQPALTAFEHGITEPKFSAVAYALADDLPAFLRIHPRTGLTPSQLKDWPVFEEFRQHADFRALCQEASVDHRN